MPPEGAAYPAEEIRTTGVSHTARSAGAIARPALASTSGTAATARALVSRVCAPVRIVGSTFPT